ncbi:MAG TPA: sulfatase-like hydrolase/transferase [Actinomycetota bacterium]|nr:sulfatase-like hydrolase/transferase [Actinomycetota bacterium]
MHSPAGRCAAAILALAGVLVPAAAEGPDGDRVFFAHQTAMVEAPVVLVVFDELPLATLLGRDGRIDARLFPGFAELQRRSTWYRNTTASETFTKEARPALLTGTYPIRDLGRSFKYPKSLFSLLGATHEVRAADIPPNVCPPSLCDEPIGAPPVQRFHAFGRGDKGALFLSFLGDLAPPDRPRLHLLHLVFPHGPWRYLPDGRRYLEVDPMPGEVNERGRGTSWRRDGWLVTQGYQRHVLQTQLADKLVSALLVKLKRTKLFDDALLVVTADHGIGWEPGAPKRLPNKRTAGTLGWVPLFVKAPGQRDPYVSDAPAQTVDVLPTIAGHLDAATWPGVDGIPLATEHPLRRRRLVVDVRVPRGLRLLRRAVEEKHELLGGPDGKIDPWRVAPGAAESLVGLQVGEMTVGGPGAATFRSAALEALVASGPREGTFPAFFEGTIDGVTGDRRPLVAIAVNGKIAGVTRSYRSYGLLWFGALLRPGAFTEGDDEVELFLVEDVRGRSVVPLPRAGAEPATRW